MNNQLHDLSALFRTNERILLLRTVLARQTCTVQQIAEKTKISKGLVSQYLALLEREGLLSRKDRTYHTKLSARTTALKRFLNIDQVSGVFHKPAWALGIGMYGSWAEGTNREESDLDLWILLKDRPAGLAVAGIERGVSQALSSEVHILLLNEEKLAAMKRSDEPFYRLFTRQSVILEGEFPEPA